jgi:chitinase
MNPERSKHKHFQKILPTGAFILNKPTLLARQQRITSITLFVVLLLVLTLWLIFKPQPPSAPHPTHPWVTGYLPAYQHDGNNIPFMTEQDYAMLTHIAHASAIPRADGSLDTDTNRYLPASRHKAVQNANEHQRPILLTINGSYQQFSPAIRAETRQTFIQNILTILDNDAYDGVDIDMEPVTLDENLPNPDFIAFITELHSALQTRMNAKLGRPPLLTTAVSIRDRYIMAQLADKFDQINIMSYDMAQPHEGWVTWFDSPLYNGGLVFPDHPRPLPAIDLWVKQFLAAGVPRHKLGIGISLDVACWYGGTGTSTGGATLPRQVWRTPPTYAKHSYAELKTQGYLPDSYGWDETAQMAWFGVDLDGSEHDLFCNFNDARAIASKIAYVKAQGLGGFIIWALSQDQLDSLPTGQQRPLRQAIAAALQK